MWYSVAWSTVSRVIHNTDSLKLVTLFPPGVCMIESKVLGCFISSSEDKYIAGLNNGDIWHPFISDLPPGVISAQERHQSNGIGCHQGCLLSREQRWESSAYMVDFGWCKAITNLAPKGEANLIPTWNNVELNLFWENVSLVSPLYRHSWGFPCWQDTIGLHPLGGRVGGVPPGGN